MTKASDLFVAALEAAGVKYVFGVPGEEKSGSLWMDTAALPDGDFVHRAIDQADCINLNLVVIVLRDDAYGMIKWKQSHEDYPTFGMDYGNPDFVAYAQSYGARGHRVESADAFAPLLREALERPGVDLIELPIDYSDDDRILNEDIPRMSASLTQGD